MMLAFLFGTLIATVAPSPALDIASAGIILEQGWYSVESERGRRFRWVDNDATFKVEAPTARLVYVTLGVAGGPGLGETSFAVRVLDTSNRQVDAVLFSAQNERQTLVLPVNAGGSTFKLHVDGGGKRVGRDPRVLNFRVFNLTFPGTLPATLAEVKPPVQSGADISASGVRIGNGWYPLEHFKGDTFRWVNNNAQLIVDARRDEHAQLRLAVATGPGMSERPFTLYLRDGGGRALGSAQVQSSNNVSFTVDLRPGLNAFVLHADGGGKPTPSDPRTLNFRVMHVTLVT